MSVDDPTTTQILVAWRENKWVVQRNGQDMGAYAYRNHAMARGRALATEAWGGGRRCYILILEQDGRWEERPCPRPARENVDH